jgi:hypothetical protein
MLTIAKFLNRYHGQYFLRIEVLAVTIRYTISGKTGRTILDIVIRNNGESYKL